MKTSGNNANKQGGTDPDRRLVVGWNSAAPRSTRKTGCFSKTLQGADFSSLMDYERVSNSIYEINQSSSAGGGIYPMLCPDSDHFLV